MNKDTLEYTKKLSILFVEDHEELRINTVLLLESLFKTADSAVNGKDGLDKYLDYKEKNSKYYDIVLSDIKMPMMNGIELTEKIYEYNPSQIIIILSAFDDSKYLLKLINLGIAQFLQKPISSTELLKTFKEASKKMSPSKSLENINISEILLGENTHYSKDSKSIKVNNDNVYLTKFEIIFLELLLSSLGKIHSNEDIVLHYISLGEIINASNIRKLVSKLRKKLPINSLESIYGIGYKLVPFD